MTEDTERCSGISHVDDKASDKLGSRERLMGGAGCVGKQAKRTVQAKAHGWNRGRWSPFLYSGLSGLIPGLKGEVR